MYLLHVVVQDLFISIVNALILRVKEKAVYERE